MAAASQSSMQFAIRVDGVERKSEEFKAARKDANIRIKDGLKEAGEKVALPAVRGLAPVKSGRLKQSLVAKATNRSAYVTTNLRGEKGRYVGLIEFGGTVKGPILPKSRKAVVVNGHPVAAVTTPRKYEGKHFMTRGVQSRQTQITETIRRNFLEAFAAVSD